MRKDPRLARLGLRLSLVTVSVLSLLHAVQAQTNANDFKVPDGYIKAPFDGFTGVLMLDPKRAAGMFVAYLDGKETAGAVHARLLKHFASMFVHESDKQQDWVAWVSRPLPSRPRDGGGGAVMNQYLSNEVQLQVSAYEHKGGPRPFVYGYFAMRHRTPRNDDGDFLDNEGKGVKAFDKLWKSFPK